MRSANASGRRRKPAPWRADVRPGTGAPAPGAVAHVQVFPYEVAARPGQKQAFTRAAVRRQGQLHSRRAGRGGDVDASISCSGTVGADGIYVAPAQGSTRGLRQGDGRRRDRSGARARRSRRCRGPTTSRTPPPRRRRLVDRRARQSVPAHRRGRRQGARAAARRHRRPAREGADGPGRTDRLHDRSRRARRRAAPPARRRRASSTSATRWCSSATARSSSCIRGRRLTR